MKRNSPKWEERIDMAIDYMRNDFKTFLRKTLTRAVWLLLILIAWKSVRTDWIAKIPQKGGGILIYYPEISPLINPPRPSAENATFADELRAFASGAGPFLDSEGITLSPNWPLITFKILAIMTVFCFFAAIQGAWLVKRLWPLSQTPKNLDG